MSDFTATSFIQSIYFHQSIQSFHIFNHASVHSRRLHRCFRISHHGSMFFISSNRKSFMSNFQQVDHCRTCETIMGLAEYHFNNHVDDQAALQTQLQRECIFLGLLQGQEEGTYCRNYVDMNIIKIFDDLSHGISVYQTCVDTGECNNTV